MFKSILKYLGEGYIRKNKTNVYLEIKSLSAFKEVLFPIFDKYPLKFGKLKAYLIFKNIVEEMLKKNHLNLEGLLRIIYASHHLNVETTRRTEESKNDLLKFLESKHGQLPAPEKLEINSLISVSVPDKQLSLSTDFMAGLIDGDGSFNVSFQMKPYRRVRVNFTVVQESSCKELLYELKSYFSCGSVYDLPSAASSGASPTCFRKGRCIYKLEDVNLILNNLAPILNKIYFSPVAMASHQKSQDYKTMIKVCEILKYESCESLTDEILIKVIKLAYEKNKLGKKRTISKEELIQKVKDQSKMRAVRLGGKKELSVKPVIIQKRGLTSCSLPYTKLNPDFVSGFVDGEGSFYIGMSADKKRTVG